MLYGGGGVSAVKACHKSQEEDQLEKKFLYTESATAMVTLQPACVTEVWIFHIDCNT